MFLKAKYSQDGTIGPKMELRHGLKFHRLFLYECQFKCTLKL